MSMRKAPRQARTVSRWWPFVALGGALATLSTPASAAYFRMSAAAGHPEPLFGVNNSIPNYRWHCFVAAHGFVQLQSSGPSAADCPFSGGTEIPWVVSPLVQQPTSTRNVNIWVSGYLKDNNDWIWLQAYSYTVSGAYYAASSVGNPSSGNFDISLGNVSTPANGTIKVIGFFQTPTTAYTTPQSNWATVAWNYDAT